MGQKYESDGTPVVGWILVAMVMAIIISCLWIGGAFNHKSTKQVYMTCQTEGDKL